MGFFGGIWADVTGNEYEHAISAISEGEAEGRIPSGLASTWRQTAQEAREDGDEDTLLAIAEQAESYEGTRVSSEDFEDQESSWDILVESVYETFGDRAQDVEDVAGAAGRTVGSALGGASGGVPWYVWLLGGAALIAWLSQKR